MITRITLGLAIAAALPLAAQAHDGPHAAPKAATPDSLSATAQPEALVVVRDADTGKLRPATTEEREALKNNSQLRAGARMAARSATAVTPLMKTHRSGAVGVRLTEDMLNHSVMVRGEDGTLEEVCFSTKEEAEAFVRSGAKTAKVALPTE